ncbi:MAG: amidohydrolase family protein [Pyrinomonadaceae bacterium]
MSHGQRPLPVVFVALVALLATSLPRTTSAQRSAIDTYAITNASSHGRAPIECGTYRNGLKWLREHNALCASLMAWFFPARDANTPAPPAATATKNAGRSIRAAAAQTTAIFRAQLDELPGLQPEAAADIIRPGGDAIEAARNAESLVSPPRAKAYYRQSAITSAPRRKRIVRSPVALHVGFTPLRTGEYPQSLMGVIASIRQMLIDAARYREANAIYERNPRGLRRPDQDKSLQSLLPVLAREMPVVMVADREREINRALDIAQEFNLRLVIAGGGEAWKVTDRLRAQNVPVLLSLNFPRRVTAPSPEADPDPVRILRDRVDAPKTAAKLAAAGVPFAFQSGAMTNMADFLANAAKAVENGLARDEALRAMTIRSAEILGVANQLGTIEPGKIANLTVTRGDIFDRNRRIAHVFIDGRPVELRPVVAGGGAGGTAGVSGTWTLRVNTGEGQDEEITLNLQQEGDRLQGSIQGALGSAQIANASIGAGGDLRFTVPVQLGGQTTEATFTGNVTGNTMRGTVGVVGRAPATFTGTRPGGAPSSATPPRTGQQQQPGTTPPVTDAPSAPPTTANLTGTWTITVEASDQRIPVTLSLQQQGASVSGTLQSQFGSAEIANGSVGADGFRFTATITLGGQTVEVAFAGTATGNEMRGTATTPQGAVPFSGTRPQER